MFLVGFGYVCSQPTNWRGRGKWWADAAVLNGRTWACWITLTPTCETQGSDDTDSATVSSNKTAVSLCTLYRKGFSFDFLAASPWNSCLGVAQVPLTFIVIWFIDVFLYGTSTLGHTCFWKTGKQCLPIFKVKRQQASCTVVSYLQLQTRRSKTKVCQRKVFLSCFLQFVSLFFYGKTALRIVWLP